MPNIILKNVYKKYKNTPPILTDFSLEVKDNEIVAILGSSGSGKTSLLRLIAGLDEVSKGQVFIGNKLVNSVEATAREIAMVFQDQNCYPHLNIYENIALPLKADKLTKNQIKEQISDIAKTLKLENLLYTKPSNLSLGQRQCLAIAKAIVQNPKVFLLDEPFANIDPLLKADIKKLVLSLKDSLQSSFIFATHNQQDALSIADRIVIMKNGFIKQVDTPKDMYNNPKNLFVAEFIGHPKMNLIHGELKKMGDQIGLSFKNNFISLDKNKVRHIVNSPAPSNKIVLGIRPEHIKVINVEHSDLNGVFNATIKQIHQVGSETFIDVDVSNIQLTLKSPNNVPLFPGDTVKIGLFLKKAHIFDEETDEILSN